MAVVGRIPYLNCALFFDRWGEGGPALVDLAPRQLGEEALAGRIDAGPMAEADVIRLRDTFEPLGEFGISCPRAAVSVLLFSRTPMDELAGAVIGVTGETATSVRLLKVLLHHKYGVRAARYTTPDDPDADALLLIGDAAMLAAYQDPQPWCVRPDLAPEGVAGGEVPFVFARWVVRRSLPEKTKQNLESHVAVAFDEGNRAREPIAQVRGTRLGIPTADVLAYFDEFRFVLTEEDVRAEARFAELLEDTPDA